MGFSTMSKGIYHLKGTVKHYDWGGFSFIPSLLNIHNTGERPFAEYWLGVHPLGLSFVQTNGEEKKLSELVPGLPYLLKVLDVKDMLSIQVHPSREAAAKEFDRENSEGIPLDSPIRNYKDANHKPELMVALSDFWLLHGFKPEKELEFTLLNVVELRELLRVFNHSGYSGLYKYIMELPQVEVNRILTPLVNNLAEVYQNTEADKEDEDFWVGRAAKLFSHGENIDRGIFSFFLFNLVHLQKGEGIFQGAGVPHAYLQGQNVEIMANSDNVLRGGLTNKHIDVAELMKHIRCVPVIPEIIKGKQNSNGEIVYPVPVNDFRLSFFDLMKNEQIELIADTTEILLLTEGKVTVQNKDAEINLEAGNPAALILPGSTVTIKTGSGAKLFRASVPKA